MKQLLTALISVFALVAVSCKPEEPEVEVTSITLSSSSLELVEESTHTLKATVAPSNATDNTLIWSSSDEAVAKVDQNGKISAIAPGTATITVISGNVKSATCKVTVVVKVNAVTAVNLNKSSLSLVVGDAEILTASIEPADATYKTITWSSSDEAVATVSQEGEVTAVDNGTATIYAKSHNDIAAECIVTVKYLPGTSKIINNIQTVYIPAGTFQMGSLTSEPGRNDDEIPHSVTLTKGFFMGKYEVTNSQYCEFLNDMLSEIEVVYSGVSYYKIYMTCGDYGRQEVAETVGDDADGLRYDHATQSFYVDEGYGGSPMKWVSWYGASEYAKWVGGALPTEAQWEYACRGGQTESLPFGIGDGTKLTDGMASFNSAASYDLSKNGSYQDANGGSAGIKPVGSYTSNAWGLYDMHGNVLEWCSDWYDEKIFADDSTDPTGPSTGTDRVRRGGGYMFAAALCRSAYRPHHYPLIFARDQGFRIIFAE